MTSHETKSFDVTINVACELSQPIGKTGFSGTAKILKKQRRAENKNRSYI